MTASPRRRTERQPSAPAIPMGLYVPAMAVLDRSVSERKFQAQVLKVAKLNGWRAYFTWSSLHSPAGMPDLILCRPPRLIFAELKTETGRTSPSQRAWLRDLIACPGVSTYLWRPSDWSAITKILEREP